MIEAQDLTKHYAAFPAVKGITFRVDPGEVVGFLGPNGAGKTTTLRMLTGYLPATRGTARLAGLPVTGGSREVRRKVGYLPEDVPLYRDLTVIAFLELMAGIKEIPPSQVRAEVGRVIEAAGLEPVRTRLVGKCSKGYRQRTGLANALLGDPPVLLLDEPTSGLDPNQVVEVRELIRALSGEKTVLLSSHILSEVAQVCGRVIIINKGELVASGSAEDLARRYGGGARLRIRARGVSAEQLQAVAGVHGVDRSEAPEGWTLHVTEPDAVAAAIAHRVVSDGGALLELRQGTVDLEAVFRRATGDADA